MHHQVIVLATRPERDDESPPPGHRQDHRPSPVSLET